MTDITTLRTKHRICGILTGTLPHLAQQNIFLGVPLVLIPEEVILLVEKGGYKTMLVIQHPDLLLYPELAVIIDDSCSHPSADIAHLQRWNAERLESMQQQIALGEAKGAKEAITSGRAMTEAAIQKRREREEKRARHNAVGTSASDAALSTNFPSLSTPAPATNHEHALALGARESTRTGTYNVTIPASSSELPWYSPSLAIYTTITSAKRAGVWTYPETLEERAKCGVFRGLWEQGFFMGGGIKFGGDYLVYPGSYRFIAEF
jgi:tRNA-splicing endonuclease subunit Sen34